MATKQKTVVPAPGFENAAGTGYFNAPAQEPDVPFYNPATNQGTYKEKTPTPNTQQDINHMLSQYMEEMGNLGPEYQAEMDYLKPYLAGTPMTFQGLESQSQADESPTGSKSVQAAEQGVANAISNQPAPGFGAAAQEAGQFEQSIPYSQVLQDVLQAGKNEILGYSTIPDLTTLNTSQWPEALKGVVPYLKQSIGYTSTGIPNPATAAFQAGQQLGGYNPATTPGAPTVGANGFRDQGSNPNPGSG